MSEAFIIFDEDGKKVLSDLDLTTAIAVSPVSISYPFPNNLEFKLYEQEFAILLSYYEPQVLGTKHETFPNAVLVEENKTNHIGGTVAKFTRSFLDVPNITIVEPTTMNVSFPALYNGTKFETNNEGEEVEALWAKIREPIARTVSCEARFTYYDLSNAEVIDETTPFNQIEIGNLIKYEVGGETYKDKVTGTTVASITVFNDESETTINLQDYNRNDSWFLLKGEIANIDVDSKFSPTITHDFQANEFDYDSPITNENLPIDSFTIQTDYVDANTTPNFESYLVSISKEEMIRITDSEIEHFMGNVWRKKEIFTKAI